MPESKAIKYPTMLLADGTTVGAACGDDALQKLCVFRGEATLQAAKSDAKPNALRRFEMDLYNGGAMNFWWTDLPVVVDLAGMVFRQDSPAFRDHNPQVIVGHTDTVKVEGSTLRVAGVLSGTNEQTREIIGTGDNGFPWQASMGAEILSVEEIKAGTTVEVNGKSFAGPMLVVRTSKLMEASFVPLGADDTTVSRLIAASRSTTPNTQAALAAHKENTMDPKFKEWLKAQGFTDSEIESFDTKSTVGKALQASYDASIKAAAKPVEPKTPEADPMAQYRLDAAAETERINGIRKICAGANAGEIEAQAIREGWTVDKADLEVLRASRAQGSPAVHGGTSGKPIAAKSLEAAAMLASADHAEVEKTYDEQTIEAAGRISREYGGMNLSTLFLAAARANGYQGHSTKVNRDVLKAAYGQLNAGYSSIDVSGILSNIANKTLLSSFGSVEQAWQSLADITPASDFKTMTRYRLTGDAVFEKVSNGGEIKSGTLGEESFTNKVDTYARMFGISRQDFINDDLGALTIVPRKLGRGAALKLNSAFWTEWLDDATFFTAPKNNYITGATTALTVAGLNAAVTKFRRQVDADGDPIGVGPSILVVPPELEATALELTRSVTVNSGGAATASQIPNINIFQGRFQVVVSQYLTATKVWYLVASPMDLATIEVAFLNNQRVPFVEQADADFSTLGVQMRGYFDFGVAKQDYRGAVKSKGEA